MTSSGANNAQITLTNSPNVTVTGSGVVTVSTTPSTITINAPVPANYWTLNGASNIYNNNSGGKVGIGVTAPRYQLDIAYNTTAFNSSLHIGKGMADEGAYLSSGYPHQFVLSGGAAYNEQYQCVHAGQKRQSGQRGVVSGQYLSGHGHESYRRIKLSAEPQNGIRRQGSCLYRRYPFRDRI